MAERNMREKIWQKMDEGSKQLARYSNPTLTRITADATALAAMAYVADQMGELNSATSAVMGGAAALGLYAFDKGIKRLIERRKEKGPMPSRMQTASLAALLFVAGYSLSDNIGKICDDVITDSEDEIVFNQGKKEEPLTETKPAFKTGKYSLPDYSKVRLAPKGTEIGDVQRTYRWKPVIEAVENKYRMPKGTMAGLIMQESYGDPLQPNSGLDGGIGLIHTQGTTAKHLGLNIHGDSDSDHDPQHGKELDELFNDCDNSLECVAKFDERADPLKNLDAIARYMMEGFKKHGSWEKAVQYVRGPGFVGKIRGVRYMSKVFEKTNAYNNKIREAEKDFERRNNGTISWNQYQSSFHQMCGNFGLEEYL